MWNGGVTNTYIDRALPFGLRSAHKIFNAIADFIAWVLSCPGVQFQLHYLDDFLLLGTPNSQQGREFLTIAVRTLTRLGIPIAVHKTEGPATSLTFLGILIDTENFELRLPQDKLARLQDTLQHRITKQFCTRRDLESLLGQLSHAATVISQGRVFLRQLFTLLSLDRAPHHLIRLNIGAKADIIWWQIFYKTGMESHSSLPQLHPYLSLLFWQRRCGDWNGPVSALHSGTIIWLWLNSLSQACLKISYSCICCIGLHSILLSTDFTLYPSTYPAFLIQQQTLFHATIYHCFNPLFHGSNMLQYLQQ